MAHIDTLECLVLGPSSIGSNLPLLSQRSDSANSACWGAMIDGTRLWEIPAADLLFLAVNGVFYFGLGFLTLKGFERVARDRGLLGHY